MRVSEIRAVPFEATTDRKGRRLEGYAAVFNSTATITDGRGTYDEQFLPGSFDKTIAERASRVKLMFDHGRHPMFGQLPIGAIDKLSSDERGLFVSAPLHDNWMTAPIADAIDSGAIHGMSIQFHSIKDRWEPRAQGRDLPLRLHSEVALSELGPVVTPYYDLTEVALRGLATVLDDAELLPQRTAHAAAPSGEPAPATLPTVTEVEMRRRLLERRNSAWR